MIPYQLIGGQRGKKDSILEKQNLKLTGGKEKKAVNVMQE